AFAALGAKLRAAPPAVIVTCARGSSDHAATYGKYLIETRTGIPVASAAPSVASVYAASAVQGHALCIAISQSGRSPDLLA
ncbi:SIS domain-containing protein, partial [Klebsiella aerogenes]|uniref:SIS domain-containing protein n=2 Tax=Pseudomonadota TaxID=1224 RepID=UPI003D01AC38